MTFRRWAAHCVSIVTLLMLVVTSEPTAQQSDKKPDPQTTGDNTQSNSTPAPVVPSPDPSPHTGQETRQFNKEYIQTQRDIAIASKQTANYTLVLIWVGIGVGLSQIVILVAHACIYASQLRTTRAIERAYIDLSHVGALQLGPTHASVSLSMKNNGKTPSDILGGRINLAINNLPQGTFGWVPLSTGPQLPAAFINPSDALHFGPVQLPLGATPITASTTVLVIGHVDYRDRFGGFHRSGYARQFITPTPANGNNLVFSVATAGLNYDRPLTKEERQQYAN